MIITSQNGVEALLNSFTTEQINFKTIFCVGSRTKKLIEKRIGSVVHAAKNAAKLAEYLATELKNKEATFYARVSGDSMIGAGLDDGDLLVIDRSKNPENGKIAICLVDGEFTVKRIKKEKNRLYLMPENKKYKPIELKEENELIIWGVVEYVIKKVLI